MYVDTFGMVELLFAMKDHFPTAEDLLIRRSSLTN